MVAAALERQRCAHCGQSGGGYATIAGQVFHLRVKGGCLAAAEKAATAWEDERGLRLIAQHRYYHSAEYRRRQAKERDADAAMRYQRATATVPDELRGRRKARSTQ